MLTDWKPVYGRIEARDNLPARARIGGTLAELTVAEGDSVTAGQPIAVIHDDKLDFQLTAVRAQIEALSAQKTNAEADLKRGEALKDRGVTTAQRLDALRTQVDVLTGQIAAQQAQARVIEQQKAEGQVLAPVAGRVLTVPQAPGAVVMPGEAVATVGGGFYLRLAIPERHADALSQGAAIPVDLGGTTTEGRLARIYPQIENGRVIADVELPDLDAAFVDARVLVRVPVGQRQALVVPVAAIRRSAGLDMVTLDGPDGPVQRVVLPGAQHLIDGVQMVEIVTGLSAGDRVSPVAAVRHD
ncbi:efflux RND transporter periplasmic adaptor subunit [Paracoccus sp. p4-l81]|uniref:efflux RND transporter periplasmic adaptor subunit n=1 Tax=Paracoccus sp. p4-l81 TaxID=3342806 RepID=UPI0035B784FB